MSCLLDGCDVMAERNTDNDYEKLRTERMVEEKIKSALKEYDEALWEKIKTYITIALTKFESAYGVGKFIVVAVALLLIGTAYQLFETLVRSGVGK